MPPLWTENLQNIMRTQLADYSSDKTHNVEKFLHEDDVLRPVLIIKVSMTVDFRSLQRE